MRVACLGGGPAGLTFAIAMKLRDPAHDIVVVERNRPYDTFGWGVVLSDETLANLGAADPESAEAIRRAFVYWDDIAVFYRGQRHALDGPRLLRHRPQAAAQHSAGPGAGTGRQAQVRDRDRRRRALPRPRPGRCRRWGQLQGARRLRPRLQARHRRARLQVHLARHPPEVRRRLHLHLREDREGLDLGARLPVRRRHRDLHRRVLGADVAAGSASTA